jgi:subfamily B ATP-binding cassette protein MsbA
MSDRDVSRFDQLASLKRAARYRPAFTIFIIAFSTFAALLEGVGLGFLLPIIEVAQAGPEQAAQDAEGVVAAFLTLYDFLGLPFTLEYILLGVGTVITVRYASSFAVEWLGAKLVKEYERDLKNRAFKGALHAEISYYDREGSDDILNAIVTQTRYAGKVIRGVIKVFERFLLSIMYLIVALILSPTLTILSVVLLGGLTYLIRGVLEPGYTVGDRVANANEQLQKHVQAGTQGIRDVKLFQMVDEVYTGYREAVNQYTSSSIDLERNKAGIRYSFELITALLIFALIYLAITVFSLSLATLGVFLFAMFQLAPKASQLNKLFYAIEGDLPHLVRTHWFIDELNEHQESTGTDEVPEEVEQVQFEDVSFSYDTGDEQVLEDIKFRFNQGEFIGFVGQSGAGKSTIVSLFARMYEPDEGKITANGIPIDEFDVFEWREKIGMVRQDPHIFNDTLQFNLTIGNRSASDEEVQQAAEIAKIDEFIDDLPDGYHTKLGDEGVQLSGGQRQRVSLARALLTDAEFLVLDEATSDLDSNLEQEIHRAIENLEDEYTILSIAHRLSTVQNADRIYTIESGQITEIGTHEELLDKQGKYAELYSIQS